MPFEAVLAELKTRLGTRASDAAAVREHHSHGESYHPPAPPDIVCFPKETREVSGISTPASPSRAASSMSAQIVSTTSRLVFSLRPPTQ